MKKCLPIAVAVDEDLPPSLLINSPSFLGIFFAPKILLGDFFLDCVFGEFPLSDNKKIFLGQGGLTCLRFWGILLDNGNISFNLKIFNISIIYLSIAKNSPIEKKIVENSSIFIKLESQTNIFVPVETIYHLPIVSQNINEKIA